MPRISVEPRRGRGFKSRLRHSHSRLFLYRNLRSLVVRLDMRVKVLDVHVAVRAASLICSLDCFWLCMPFSFLMCHLVTSFFIMTLTPALGFEPRGPEGQPLSRRPQCRVMRRWQIRLPGIEPGPRAWEAPIMPLDHSRVLVS
jgi:hypothetical protein